LSEDKVPLLLQRSVNPAIREEACPDIYHREVSGVFFAAEKPSEYTIVNYQLSVIKRFNRKVLITIGLVL
jgi:hypothetical protein